MQPRQDQWTAKSVYWATLQPRADKTNCGPKPETHASLSSESSPPRKPHASCTARAQVTSLTQTRHQCLNSQERIPLGPATSFLAVHNCLRLKLDSGCRPPRNLPCTCHRNNTIPFRSSCFRCSCRGACVPIARLFCRRRCNGGSYTPAHTNEAAAARK